MSKQSYDTLVHPPEIGAPLIFACHGTGGDAAQFFSFARQVDRRAGVVAPNGDVEVDGASRFFKRRGADIYDMQDLPGRVDKMVAFVAAHKADHPTSPVYAMGYSNGANILSSVFLRRPDLFDRLALMHPLVPWTPAPHDELGGRQVLITAGRQDAICSWEHSERLITWLSEQGVLVETLIHSGGHDIAVEEYRAVRAFLTRPAALKGDMP